MACLKGILIMLSKRKCQTPASNGAAKLTEGDEVYYGIVDGELVTF